MRKPFMSNDNLLVTLQTRLDVSGLPIPEHNVARPITAADPFTIGREANLASIPSNLMIRKPLLPVLAEIIRAVDENLVV